MTPISGAAVAATPPEATGVAPALRRAVGELVLDARMEAGTTVIRTVRQRAPMRAFLPAGQRDEPATAVVANLSGGVVSGDRLSLEALAGPRAAMRLCGQAAEKVYRASGAATEAEARVETVLGAREGAWLEYLPQGTIVFDGAHLRRRTTLDLRRSSALLAGELLFLGRAARGESFDGVRVRDQWRVRVDERLVWADALRLDGDGLNAPARSVAGFGGAGAIATTLLAMTGAEALLPAAREVARATARGLRWGVTAFEGVLVARLLGGAGPEIREAFGALWRCLRAQAGGWPAALPAIWSC